MWDFLVDPEKRARWFAGGPMEQRKGGKVELIFNHKCLAPDETPSEDHKHHQEPGFKKVCTILRWEPPHVLCYTFDAESEVTFELTPLGKSVQLVLTHRSRGGDLRFLTGYASGWHTHLAQLVAQLEGTDGQPHPAKAACAEFDSAGATAV